MIRNLKINNFTRIKEADLDLSGKEEIAIVGRVDGEDSKSNGAAKSSLVNFIAWILYGKVPGLHNSELLGPFGDSMGGEMEQALDIEGKGIIVKISRTYSKERTHLDLIINGMPFEGTKPQTQEKIVQLLGCDIKVFYNTRFFMQEKSKSFLLADPAEREKFLIEFFDLTTYSKCHKIVAKKLKEFVDKEHYNNGEIDTVNNRLRIMKGQKFETQKDDVKKKGISNKEEMELLKEKVAEQREYLDSIKENRNKVKQLRKDVESKKDNLKRCNDDAREVSDEAKEIRKEIARREGRSVIIEEELKIKERPEVVDITDVATSVTELGEEIAAVKSQMVEEKDRIAKLKSADGGLCPLCEAVITPEKRCELLDLYTTSQAALTTRQVNLTKDFKAFKKKLMNMEHKNDKIRSGQLEWEKKKQELDLDKEYIKTKQVEAAKKIEKKRAFDDEGVEIVAKLKSIKGRILKETSKIDEIKENRYEKDVGRMLEEIAGLNSARMKLSGEFGKVKTLLAEQKAAQSKHDVLEATQKKLKAFRQRYEVLETLFSRKGLVSEIVRQLVKEIEYEANKVLESMEYDGFEVLIDCDKETAIGDLKHSIEVSVQDDLNIKRRIETYSGGEKAVINFAVRVALSDIMTRKHDVNFAGGFLDEVFAQIDPKGRDVMIDVLGYIRKNFFFDQIFLISHTELKESLKDCLMMEKENGVSKPRML